MSPASQPDDDPVKFTEAIRAFRARVPMTDEEFAELQDAEREFAFTVAGAAQVDLVTDVYEAVARAIENGTDIDDFKADIGVALEESWGGEEPGRLETIFGNGVMSAYNAGRYEAATAPNVQEDRPYWRFDDVGDGPPRETEICITCHGVILPADHEWWQTHYPLMHFGCRSYVTTLTKEQAEAEGITSSPPSVRAEPGFGAAPSGGGRDWTPDKTDIPGPLRDAYDDAG